VIRAGENALMLAPTGSGKTLAAFLAAIDHVMFEPLPPKGERCRVLYLSPLKALAVDIERNLRVPIAGVAGVAQRLGVTVNLPEIAVRTGDTPASERAAFNRKPADILITTPESLYLLLTSNAREALRSIRYVIVDEIHAMLGSKRGAHLALSLERLRELTTDEFQRIGLSATVRPLDEAARFLGGPRPVTIVNAGAAKNLDIRVEVPIEVVIDLARIRLAIGGGHALAVRGRLLHISVPAPERVSQGGVLLPQPLHFPRARRIQWRGPLRVALRSSWSHR